MNVMIIGCESTGVRLAKELSLYGHDVSVVDSDPANIRRLGSGFTGLTAVGVPVDQDVLQNAGIRSCDALVAITSDDNVNLMVAQMAQEVFHVGCVIASIVDPSRETVFSDFGLRTICPTRLTTNTLYELLIEKKSPSQLHFGCTTVSFAERVMDRSMKGKGIEYVLLREHEEIFALQRKNGTFYLANNIPAGLTLAEGDRVICACVAD